MDISILICTRNRADSLGKTLASLAELKMLPGLEHELIVVDNGSTDATAAVANAASFETLRYRVVVEPKPGLANARNRALSEAAGKVLLFTDDDVAPNRDWLKQMSAPLLRGECDGVTGKVELAPHLIRPWLTPHHQLMLASLSAPINGKPELVGANMGFNRSVLEKVPVFDPELGAGALGYSEETLFSLQMCEAGLKIQFLHDAVVVHSPDVSRLIRSQWLGAAVKHGHSRAYIMHHWKHETLPNPRLRYQYVRAKLLARRMIDRPVPMDQEGCASWEISYLAEIETCREYLVQSRMPRNYSLRGLRQITSKKLK